MAKSKNDKQLIVVAGPNGAGKTTIAHEILEEKDIRYLSADDIAYEISPDNPLAARIQAGKEFANRLNDAILRGNSLLIESTLAGKALLSKLKEYRSE